MAYSAAALSSTTTPSSCASRAPLSSSGVPLRAPMVGLPAPVLAQAPTSPADPHPPSGCLVVEPLDPAPPLSQGPARARRPSLLQPSSSAALVVAAAWAVQRPYSCSCISSLKIFAQWSKCSGIF